MRFVPIKTVEQQGCLVLHRTRHLLVRQQTATINSIRAHLAEFGIVAPVGRRGVEHLLEVIADANDTRVPEIARACVATLGVQLQQLKTQILELDRRILAWHRSSEASRRLNHIPGVGPLLATALVASIADPKGFQSGRDFSAWIGLVPKQNSSGGKGKAWQYQQTRGSLSALPVHGGGARRHPLCQNPWDQASALACGTAGKAADEGCGYCTRQQARADRLGPDDEGKPL